MLRTGLIAALVVSLLALGAWWLHESSDATDWTPPRAPGAGSTALDASALLAADRTALVTPIDAVGSADVPAGVLVLDPDGAPLSDVVALRLRETRPTRHQAGTLWPTGVAGRGGADGRLTVEPGVALLLAAPLHGPLLLPAGDTLPAAVELQPARVLELSLEGAPELDGDDLRVLISAARFPFALDDRRMVSELHAALGLPWDVVVRLLPEEALLIGSPRDRRLLLHGLAADVSLDVRVVDDWGVTLAQAARIQPGTAQLHRETLRLHAPSRLTLRVTDERGRPLAATARVDDPELRESLGAAEVWCEQVAQTDGEGLARIPVDGPQRVSVVVSAEGHVTRGLLVDAPGESLVKLEPSHALEVRWQDAIHGHAIGADHVELSWLDDDGAWRAAGGRSSSPGLSGTLTRSQWNFEGVPWRELRIRARVGGEDLEFWHHPRDGAFVGSLACRGAIAVGWPGSRLRAPAMSLRRMPAGDRVFHRPQRTIDNLEPGRWELTGADMGTPQIVRGPLLIDVVAHEVARVELPDPDAVPERDVDHGHAHDHASDHEDGR